jgi:putative DNA primase/helicase
MSAPVNVARLITQARAVPIERELERRGIRLRGRVDRCGPCPVCGGTDRFSVNVKKQVWNCRGCGVGGDVIALVQHLDHTGFVTAVQMLAGERVSCPAPPMVAWAGSAAAEVYEREQHRKAAWLWQQREPLAGSIAETYLRKVRGFEGPLPPTLAFSPPTEREHHPALIAAYGIPEEPEPGILAEPRQVEAVHLTLLQPDGSSKADVKRNKIAIGSHIGLPIVLAPPNDLLGLAIAEGIEDALSVHAATGLGAWAAGGATFMPTLAAHVPSYIECVTVVVDNDNAGHRSTAELASHLDQRAFHVEFWGC